ncbi:MAG: acyl carrier protein [Anaerofustis sp.]|jgi:acyl carrier protein
MVFEKIKAMIAAQLEIDPEKITMESYFVDDLGADSLDVMELIMAFESEFDMEVSEESLENIKQVKDIVEYFEKN